MKNDKSMHHLRTLCIGSFLALFLSVILPIIAKIEGKSADIGVTGPYLFVGLIGVSAYGVSSSLYKRVIALEEQIASQKNDAGSTAEQ